MCGRHYEEKGLENLKLLLKEMGTMGRVVTYLMSLRERMTDQKETLF